MAEKKRFKVDGIYYEIIGDGSVAVTNGKGDSEAKSYSGDVVIPSEVTYEGVDYKVTEIGERTFYGCTGLTSVEIPNSVTVIGVGAFYNCTALTSVEIPNSVKEIGRWAFSGCTGLKNFQVNADNPAYCDIKGVLFSKDKKQLIAYPNAKVTEYKIPNSVMKIGECAFAGCMGLTSVEIPASVKGIDGLAFSGCTGLKNFQVNADNPAYCNIEGVLFSKDKKQLIAYPNAKATKYKIPNSVIIIGQYAFRDCTGLTSVKIPNSVTYIGRLAFSGCTGLTSVKIPNSVAYIGRLAFYGCTGLTSVSIGNSVMEIGELAFNGCTDLTSIEIPEGVTRIGGSAFSGCTGLTSVKIPNSVTEIGFKAFSGCTGLTSATIGKSVTYIGRWAFYGCDNLKEVTCKALTPPSVGSQDYATWRKTLYVPKASLEAYRKHKVWGQFKEILPIEE